MLGAQEIFIEWMDWMITDILSETTLFRRQQSDICKEMKEKSVNLEFFTQWNFQNWVLNKDFFNKL